MASSTSTFRIMVLFLLAVFCTRAQSNGTGGGRIKADISGRGIDFLKDVLIQKAESSLVPLHLSDIETSVKIPLLGKVRMALSNITIERIQLTSSTVKTGSSGILVTVSGATANLSMNWEYSYKARLVPISISDEGTATVQKIFLKKRWRSYVMARALRLAPLRQGSCHGAPFTTVLGPKQRAHPRKHTSWCWFVHKRMRPQAIQRTQSLNRCNGSSVLVHAYIKVEGLEVSLTISLKTVGGSLEATLLECGCHVNNIFIKLVGGASWLYQRLVDAFQRKISSAVEDAISSKINSTIVKLDNILQSIPKEVPVTNIASLNVTFVGDPELNESSVHIEIDGMFSSEHQLAFSSRYQRLQEASFSCKEASKMVEVAVLDDVLKSALSVYFEANKMHWIVDKLPDDEVLLNTTWWSSTIPQLYNLYPNCAMNLNLSVSSLPNITVERQHFTATIPFDVVIDVLDGGEAISVACISSEISPSLFARFSGTTLTGSIELNDISMHLKWSKIGDLHMSFLQALTLTVLRTLVLPYANLKLDQGYHVPVFHSYGLQDPLIAFEDSRVIICSDVATIATTQYCLASATTAAA